MLKVTPEVKKLIDQLLRLSKQFRMIIRLLNYDTRHRMNNE